MPQARGTQYSLVIYDEATYGQDPGSPSGVKIYTKGNNLGPSQNLLDDDTLLDSRGRAEPDQGNIDPSGDVPVTINANSLPYLLKHALGQVTTGRPVSNQPTSITGVVVDYAEATADTGDGTLTYTHATTSLTWADNGDTAGAAVDVSAGGVFTLESNTAGAHLVVTVTAGSLPGADQSDNDITVVNAYEHRFTVGALPTGFVHEKDFGPNISGTGRYEKTNGTRVGALTLKFPQEGYAEGVFSLKGAKTTPAATALDGSPLDPGHKGFTTFSAAVMEGGSVVSRLQEIDISLNNDLDESAYALGGLGTRAELAEGFANIGGRVKGMFVDNSLTSKALAGTESSVRVELKRGDGFGTLNNEACIFQVNQLKYQLSGVPVSGPAGLYVDQEFKGYSKAADLGLLFIVRNQTASLDL